MTIPNPRKRKRRNPHVIVLQRRNITRKSIVIIHLPPPHLLRIRLPYMLKRRKNPRLQIRKNTTIEDENIELSLSLCFLYDILRENKFQFFLFSDENHLLSLPIYNRSRLLSCQSKPMGTQNDSTIH